MKEVTIKIDGIHYKVSTHPESEQHVVFKAGRDTYVHTPETIRKLSNMLLEYLGDKLLEYLGDKSESEEDSYQNLIKEYAK